MLKVLAVDAGSDELSRCEAAVIKEFSSSELFGCCGCSSSFFSHSSFNGGLEIMVSSEKENKRVNRLVPVVIDIL